MEIKNWNEYDLDEKKNLLHHYFWYYGHMLYNLKELDKYDKLLNRRVDDIFNYAVISFINRQTTELLIYSMRKNNEENLLDDVEKTIVNMNPELKRDYNETQNVFLGIIVNSYNQRFKESNLSR